jgi:hypothetical protein
MDQLTDGPWVAAVEVLVDDHDLGSWNSRSDRIRLSVHTFGCEIRAPKRLL